VTKLQTKIRNTSR